MNDERVDRKTVWIARVGAWLIRLLAVTWRVRWLNPEVLRRAHARGPVVYALWHGQLLPLLWTHRNQQVAVIISEHRDGEIIARIASALGFRPVRGSTTRGAARALLSATRELESRFDVAVTVDGPRGPAGTVAPGALVIAQRAGAPVIPTAAGASRAWRLRSWDRFMVPKLFARITVAYGDPIDVAASTARDAADETADVRDALERAAAAAAE